MKRLSIAVFSLLCTLAALAQLDIATLTNRQAEFNTALMHPDSLTFDKLIADSLSYGHSAWKIQSKKEFLQDILHGVATFSDVIILSQTISVAGENAIVREVFQADLTASGQISKVKLGILLVWTKQDGQWKLLARQAVKLP